MADYISLHHIVVNIKKHILNILFLPAGTFFRYIRLKITGREYLVSGTCKCCGKCCRLINLKYHKGWIKEERQFQELLHEHPEYTRFTVVGKGEGGYLQFNCSWLDPILGCSDYHNRLDICEKYPGKSLLMQGGNLLNDCGYTIREGIPFKKYLSAEIEKKKENETDSSC